MRPLLFPIHLLSWDSLEDESTPLACSEDAVRGHRKKHSSSTKMPNYTRKAFFSLALVCFFFFNNYLFLAVWGLSCSMQALLWLVGLAAPWHLGSWFPTRDQTHVLCIGRQIPNHWTTREGPCPSILNTESTHHLTQRG